MKKTVWIVNEYNGPINTRSRQSNLCQRLLEAGYDAYVISGSVENKSGENIIVGDEKLQYIEVDNAKHYVIKTSSYRKSYERVLVALQFQWRIWKFRKELPKPDVIISDFAGLFGNAFLRWKKKYGTKIIYDILDLWPEAFIDMGYLKRNSLIAKFLYHLEHISYREADGIIFSFQGGRDYIIDKGWSKETGGDVDTSDIGYLNNGLELDWFDEQKESLKYDDPDLDSDKFKVIYLGSMSAFNGLDIIIDVANILQQHGEESIDILFYGYGNQEGKLRNLADNYNLHNVKFKGKLDKNYAPNVLSRGDINIFTFKDTHLLKYGTSPNKLFMYFASGKPVLSLIRPGYDLVEGNRAGISVNNDAKEAADALIKMSKINDEVYQSYCKNARTVAEAYDYKALVHELIRFIEK